MVYTVTFNPALDYIIQLPELKAGKMNRTQKESIVVGGKGINVSLVLQQLGIESTLLGFIAGFTGQEIERDLESKGCICDFVKLQKGISRINVKLKGQNETEINAQGPEIDENALNRLKDKIIKLNNGDVLVLAGSVPKTLSNEVYADFIKLLSKKSVDIVVDAEGQLLDSVLSYHPFLIKPNHHELGRLFNTSIKTKDDAIYYAKKLQDKGARNVLVSMSGMGAVLCTEDGNVYKRDAAKGVLINSVGAGDSMVAGFLSGWLKKHDYKYALELGMSAGAATAFSEGLAKKEDIKNIYDENKKD